ncbi:MAG: sensor histidine kinase [Romboutsia sp.]
MKNKKTIKGIKFTFLIIVMLSLSVMSSTIPATINFLNSSYMGSSYMHDDKKLIEDNFYKSNWFDRNILSQLTRSLAETVVSVEGLDEESKSQVESYKLIAKEEITAFNNITFIAINNESGEYYTNTNYKTVEEYNNAVNGYCDIKLSSNNYKLSYIKILDNKEYKEYKHEKLNLELDGLSQLKDADIYISIPKDLLDEDQISWEYNDFNRNVLSFEILAILLIISSIIFIISIIIYKLIKFKLFDSNSSFFKLYDKIPLEFTLSITLVSIVFNIIYYMGTSLEYIVLKIGIMFISIIMVYLLIKKFKNKDRKIDLIKETLTVKTITKVKSLITKVIVSSKKVPLINRIMIITIVGVTINILGVFISVILSFNALLFALILSNMTFLGFSYYMIKKLSYLVEIMDGTEYIKKGELGYKIKIKDQDNFTTLAENINNIGEGLENSIDSQLKSERMKSELITNVSHDLKTPLTSIINYVELIKKEENIEPEYLRDYVNVLDTKSNRLKSLIEDLFEASKASSGNVELNMETIDLKQLLRQAIGEFEEKLIELNLDIRLNLTEEDTHIKADGRRLYRVLENVLSNISKYSLNNTRVYIDLIKENNKICLTMKNISSYELNFDPKEIMERFKRADDSRNTEGSGLGLAIARDLTSIQGGRFDIEIDGDLFKAILEFNLENKSI